MNSFGNPILIEADRSTNRLERVSLGSKGAGHFSERELQELIHDFPRCLPIDEIEPGFGRPVSVCMELPTHHGFVDNFMLTPEGNVVIVEAKLWRNPDMRRRVVAQSLDYASALFEMDYGQLESAALEGDFGASPKPGRLYDLVEQHSDLDEAAFIDAVNTNLRRGRVLVLIAGDGIRTETERLVDSLQSHAGFHFSLALVEIAIYRIPGDSRLFVQPRTLARTEMIERGVVQIDDRRAVVKEAATRVPETSTPTKRRSTITSEQFSEAMDAIQPGLSNRIDEFVSSLEPLGVRPEYLASLNLKWDPPEGKPVNLLYIMKNGQVWTDAASWFAPTDLSRAYIEDLARVLGGEIEKLRNDGSWYVKLGKSAPRIEQIADRLPDLRRPIETFISRLRDRLSE